MKMRIFSKIREVFGAALLNRKKIQSLMRELKAIEDENEILKIEIRKVHRELDFSNRQVRSYRNELADLKRRHAADIRDWNNLVAWVKSVGGIKHVNHVMRGGQSTNSSIASELDSKDFQKILMLIHPDKHGGKQMAVEMTAKVLEIRKSMERK